METRILFHGKKRKKESKEIDETTLKSILNNVFEKHPDQIIFTTSAQKLQAVIMNLPYGVVAMNFQNPFLSKMRKRVF